MNLFVHGWKGTGACTSMHLSAVREEGGLGYKMVIAVTVVVKVSLHIGVGIALD
jgi:hypothetical protein